MATVEFKGKTFEVDEDGFLENLDQWSHGMGRLRQRI